MTVTEISSYELAYQIQCYLSSHNMNEEQFARLISISPHILTRFLQNQKPELSVSQMAAICDELSITMDSLVHGPVREKRFIQLIRKCSFADNLKGTCLYSFYIVSLKRWQKKKITPACLKRYNQWFLYFCSSSGENYDPSATTSPSFQFASSVCFTPKISQKQKTQLEKIIEDSKRK